MALLEELAIPYTLEILDRGKGDNTAPAFRALNPLGKVATLRLGDAVVTEQVAIVLYLADLFPEKLLAPSLTDPRRGPYLRWLVFYAACFEPALVDRARSVEPGMRAMSPYGSYDEVIDTLAAALEPGPWLLGDMFSAADVLWGMALSWTMAFKLVPPRPVFTDYAARVAARPGKVTDAQAVKRPGFEALRDRLPQFPDKLKFGVALK